jgi:hypothetical protein
MELLRSVELAFYDNERPVRADILYPQFFIQNTFSHEYDIYDVKSDKIKVIRRIYSHDGSWTEYEDEISIK